MSRSVRGPDGIISLLRGAILGRRRDARTPVTVILENETHRRLLRQAEGYASAHGVTRKDIAWGELAARHIADSLEVAYLNSPAEASSIPPGGDLTMLVVSLSATVARQLQGDARAAARRLDVEGRGDREEFEWRHVGRALEIAYLAHDQAGDPVT